MIEWINSIVQGVLTGGLYALFAAGLAIIFGVMRLVNIAHGDLIVLAAFVAMVVIETAGVDPFVSMVAVLPFMFFFGYVLLARNPQLHAGGRPPAASPGDLRNLDRHPEPPSRDLFGGLAAPEGGRDRDREHQAYRGHRDRHSAADRLRHRGRADRRTSDRLQPDAARPGVPGDLRRSLDRPAHGYPPEAHLRPRDGGFAGPGGDCRDFYRHQDQFRSRARADPAAVRPSRP